MKGIKWSVAFATLLCALVLLAQPAGLQATGIDASAIRLDYIWGEQRRLLAETFELAREVPATVAQLPEGGRLVLLGFPVAPGERGDIEFERLDVYHPTAKIIVIDGQGQHEIPRSPRVHLIGTGVADPRIRVGLSLGPDGGDLSGLVSHPAGVFQIVELGAEDTPSHRRSYEIGTDMAERFGIETQTTCGVADVPVVFAPDAALLEPPVSASLSFTHEAAIAFDTDAEFIADYASPAAANTAIGDFVTSANVIYERDLGLRLQQAYTILRIIDSYVGSNTTAQISEVGLEWESNQAGIPRTWVALLSGKGPSGAGGCEGRGLAWVNQYCDPFVGGSYSAIQVLRCLPLSGPGNTNLIGHEVGHNAGSQHTHCYIPEVDQCFRVETGCWAGAVSCPSHGPPIQDNKGTVMSYCNRAAPNGANCGANDAFFHPTVSAFLRGRIAANTPACVSLKATCPAGINELTVGNTTDNSGPINYNACISVTLGPDYTAAAGSTVNVDAPLVVLGADIALASTFTASN